MGLSREPQLCVGLSARAHPIHLLLELSPRGGLTNCSTGTDGKRESLLFKSVTLVGTNMSEPTMFGPSPENLDKNQSWRQMLTPEPRFRLRTPLRMFRRLSASKKR